MDIQEKLLNQLMKLQNVKHKDFVSSSIPTESKEKFLGIKVPILRKIAIQIIKEHNLKNYLDTQQHKYFEQDFITTIILGELEVGKYGINSFSEIKEYILNFLPYITNWSICDQLATTSRKICKKHYSEMSNLTFKLIKSKKLYTCRLGIAIFLTNFIDDNYIDKFLDLIKKVRIDEYYIHMAVGWALATAYNKYPEKIIDILKHKELPKLSHNKTIHKINESLIPTKEEKLYIKNFK